MRLNGPRQLDNFLKFTSLKWSEMHLFIVGDKFEIYMSEMARNVFKLSTMVGENFEIYISEMARMHINCPPWVGEKFKFSISEMAKNAFKLFTKVEENVEN